MDAKPPDAAEDLRDEVLQFNTNCPECNAPASTNMKLVRILPQGRGRCVPGLSLLHHRPEAVLIWGLVGCRAVSGLLTTPSGVLPSLGRCFAVYLDSLLQKSPTSRK